MNLDNVISRIQQQCPSFAGRVAGAAEFAVLLQQADEGLPAAYVIPQGDLIDEQDSVNRYRQTLTDSVAVVVVLDRGADPRGQAAISSIPGIRAELWQALLLWPPGAEYDGLFYKGGKSLQMDATRLFYQFEFSAVAELVVEDTAQPEMKAELPKLQAIDVRADVRSPMFDPNNLPGQNHNPAQPNPRTSGPDGRIEAGVNLVIPE